MNLKHSTEDWDFQYTAWELDPLLYVSPPSSIRGTTSSWCLALCKAPAVLCLPQVQIVTYSRPISRFPRIACRNQSPVGTATIANCYYWRFESSVVDLIRVIIGAAVTIGSFPYAIPEETWTRIRCTCYEGYNLQNDLCACFTLEVEQAGEWVQKGDIVYDPLNKWADSEINRVGPMVRTYINYDDTEIWES